MQGRFAQFAENREGLFSGHWINPANFLTALRAILSIPIVLLLLYPPKKVNNVMNWELIAGLIFIFAALTDKLDGYYARKNDLVTRLGQFLDPLADKILMLPVMIVLWHLRLMPLWVVLVVIAREIMVSVIRFIGIRNRISFPASFSGKIKMFSQVVVVSALIFFPQNAHDPLLETLVYLMASITIISGVDYAMRAKREIFKKDL